MTIEKAKEQLIEAKKHISQCEIRTGYLERDLNSIFTKLDRMKNDKEEIKKQLIWVENRIQNAERELQDNSGLQMRDNVLYFNGIPFDTSSGSRRSLLNRAAGDLHNLGNYDLDFYLNLTTEYGLKFERYNTTRNLELLRQFLERRKGQGIVVMLSFWDDNYEIYGDYKETFAIAKDYNFVMYEPVVELFSWESVNKTIEIAEYMKNIKSDCIVAGGAFGFGAEQYFRSLKPESLDCIDFLTIHRAGEDDTHYSKEHLVSFLEEYQITKPAGRIEFLSIPDLPITSNDMAEIMQDDKEKCGLVIRNYYNLRSRELFPDLKNEDPDPWRQYYYKIPR